MSLYHLLYHRQKQDWRGVKKPGVCRGAAMLGLACMLALTASGCTGAKDGRAGSSAPQSRAAVTPASSSAASSGTPSSQQASSTPVASSQAASQTPSQTGGKYVICIDPGHQEKVDLSEEAIAPGSNIMKTKNPGGAEGIVTKLTEYELNLEVALRLEKQLKAQGYTVVMTRTDNGGNISNIGRAQVANKCKADLFVRIHADGVDDESAHGISVLYPGPQYISDKALLANSKRAAQELQDCMVASTGAEDRGLSERSDMTGFNWCTRPMVLIEMGFMSNPAEDERMSTAAYQDKLVTGMVNGISKYLAGKGK